MDLVVASNSTVSPSHLNVVLSGVSSSTSLAAWIVLLLPQLVEQWRLKSSEGVSVGFIAVWFIGDVANLIGSLWASLLPGVIMLAAWFCTADALLIASYLYYRPRAEYDWTEDGYWRKRRRSTEPEDPTQPLLDRRNSAVRRRKSSFYPCRRDSLSSIVIAPYSGGNKLTQYIWPLLFVLMAAVFGFLFSNKEEHSPNFDHGTISLGPQILGYVSTLCYLGARLPQVYQNYKKKSVYGLSLLFFIFSMLGNITYAGGILFYRLDSQYIKLYLPWLIGSLGTIFEDCAIFIQFYIYSNDSDMDDEEAIFD